jgi:hypothetical protein
VSVRLREEGERSQQNLEFPLTGEGRFYNPGLFVAGIETIQVRIPLDV